jgi:hypothetical protein
MTVAAHSGRNVDFSLSLTAKELKPLRADLRETERQKEKPPL